MMDETQEVGQQEVDSVTITCDRDTKQYLPTLAAKCVCEFIYEYMVHYFRNIKKPSSPFAEEAAEKTSESKLICTD